MKIISRFFLFSQEILPRSTNQNKIGQKHSRENEENFIFTTVLLAKFKGEGHGKAPVKQLKIKQFSFINTQKENVMKNITVLKRFCVGSDYRTVRTTVQINLTKEQMRTKKKHKMGCQNSKTLIERRRLLRGKQNGNSY